MKCVNFKSSPRGSMLGFYDLEMDSGLVLLGCTLHQIDGRRWVNPPGRPQLDKERQLVVEKGKILTRRLSSSSKRERATAGVTRPSRRSTST